MKNKHKQVVKVIVATAGINAEHRSFNCICQVTPTYRHTQMRLKKENKGTPKAVLVVTRLAVCRAALDADHVEHVHHLSVY